MSSSVKFKWGERKSRPLSVQGSIYLFPFYKENKEFYLVCSLCAPLKVMRSWVLDLDNWNPSFTKPKCRFLSWTMNWISMSTFWLLCQSEMILLIVWSDGWKQVPQKSFKINKCNSQCWTECPCRSPQLPQTPLSHRYPTPNHPHWPQPAPCPRLVPFFTPFTIRPFASCWRK